ncbi:MAG: alkaline shock response membrane anchor protein AmaP [Chloroflexi bacterium]|nr:alkaline shock response membrane anchor protein AmaP [Chloroflexota bacterium]
MKRKWILVLLFFIPLVILLFQSWHFALDCYINRWFDPTYYNSIKFGLIVLMVSIIMLFWTVDFLRGKKSSGIKKVIYTIGWLGTMYILFIFISTPLDVYLGLYSPGGIRPKSHRPQQELLKDSERVLTYWKGRIEDYAREHDGKYPASSSDLFDFFDKKEGYMDGRSPFAIRTEAGGTFKYYVAPDRKYFILYSSGDAHKWAGVKTNNPAYDSRRGLIYDNQIDDGEVFKKE